MGLDTIIPYPNFQASIACYTDTVLSQVIRRILTVRYQIKKTNYFNLNYDSYDMWRMWHAREQAFYQFGLICFAEADKRQIPYNEKRANAFRAMRNNERWRPPLWAGWEEFHSSQRSMLLHYGKCECVAQRVLIAYGKRVWDGSFPLLTDEDFEFVQSWCGRYHFTCSLWYFDTGCIVHANQILDETYGAGHISELESPYKHLKWIELPTYAPTIELREPTSNWLQT